MEKKRERGGDERRESRGRESKVDKSVSKKFGLQAQDLSLNAHRKTKAKQANKNSTKAWWYTLVIPSLILGKHR